MTYSRHTYETDGAQTSFRYPFQVMEAAKLRAYLVDPHDCDQIPLSGHQHRRLGRRQHRAYHGRPSKSD